MAPLQDSFFHPIILSPGLKPRANYISPRRGTKTSCFTGNLLPTAYSALPTFLPPTNYMPPLQGSFSLLLHQTRGWKPRANEIALRRDSKI